ncbi:MAG: molybdate ABC transporter substrate-binding protein [Ktedonobacterales bacterium]
MHQHSPRLPRTRVKSLALTGCLVALLLGVSACGSASAGAESSAPVTLNVFAAASLQAAFTQIGQQFHHAHPNVTVTFSFGGSNTLAQQIAQGAPADVFASADSAQMDVLVKASKLDIATVTTFAHNRLVVVYPASNPAGVHTLQDLARPGLKIVLAAKAVPAGHYALTFLTKASADPAFGASYQAHVLKNVVSYEVDVKSVLAKVRLGEADAGIVYVTDAASATGSVGSLAIPDALNSLALYPIAAVAASPQAVTAREFVAYVASADGQAALAQFGFIGGSSGAQYTPPAAG